MSEKAVERALCTEVKTAGGVAYKFTSPARRSVPDRLCLYPIHPKDRIVVAQYVRFVECKDKGKKPNAGQKREIKRLRDLGFYVVVRDGSN